MYDVRIRLFQALFKFDLFGRIARHFVIPRLITKHLYQRDIGVKPMSGLILLKV